MKSAGFVLNIVLSIAVIILYVLHFSKGDSSGSGSESTVQTATVPSSIASSGIVFINSDSLLDNYTYFKNKKEELEKRQNRIKSELEAESRKLQSDVEEYQYKAGGMSELQRQKSEEELMMRQQKLVQKKDNLLDQLDEEQAKSSEELFRRLTDYLKEYNKDKQYQFILGYQKGGGILFANDSLDITASVIQGLNKAFAAESKK